MKISKRSALTGKVNTREIKITQQELDQMNNGKHIQWLCPHLSVDDREFLISGSTPEEWKETFGEDPERGI